MDHQLADPRHHERGQALILIAFAFIGLFATLALAVDGGNMYSQRRASQNAADSGALAGGYKLRLQNQAPGNSLTDQRDLLSVIHAAVEDHGVPDSDGNPGNYVNTNVVAFYTDSHGNRVGNCQIGNCPAVPTNPWGIDIQVNKPFNTYVAGVIGWNRATVGAHAVAVVHAGSIGQGNKYWAIFGDDRLGCGGDAVNVSGSTTDIVGNAHSNADFKMTGARAVTAGQVTYLDNCQHCRSNPAPANAGRRIPIEYPNWQAYRDLAQANAPANQTFPGNVRLCTGGSCSGITLGSVAAPYSYISGDLDVTGDNVVLHGLIYVGGSVRFSGRNTTGTFSIVTPGYIDMVGSAKDFAGVPYQNPSVALLSPDRHVFLFYTNGSGSNACNTSIVGISGSSNTITGAILAPNGLVDLSGSTNTVIGAIVANRVNVSGSNNRVVYNGNYFPPQPDRIELLE